MFLTDLIESGSIPVLEASVRFAARRQELIAHNIANLDTPNFRPVDVSPAEFRRVLADAVAARRTTGAGNGPLRMGRSREIQQNARGEMTLTPRTPSANILFHDRNNRDLERTMQDLAENAGAFRIASDLLRSRYTQLRDALAERVA